MRLADAGAVAALATQLGYPSTEAEIRRRYEWIERDDDSRLLVAEHHDGRVVGWIHAQKTCMLEADPRTEIWGLVVDETARGRGVGRRLLEAAEQWAREQGLTVVTLRSNSLREAARAFYEHLGYTITKNQNAFRKTL
jgi:GNAT superfamily N-acetyltransferase